MGRKTTKIKPPTAPGYTSWLDLLPEPFNRDPDVVIIAAPKTAKVGSCETTDEKYRFGVMEINGSKIGLQVLHPQISGWIEQEQIMNTYQLQMAQPQYIGKLSAVPQRLLMLSDANPLVFLRDAMWKPLMSLRHTAEQFTKYDGRPVN